METRPHATPLPPTPAVTCHHRLHLVVPLTSTPPPTTHRDTSGLGRDHEPVVLRLAHIDCHCFVFISAVYESTVEATARIRFPDDFLVSVCAIEFHRNVKLLLFNSAVLHNLVTIF